ncbi:histidine phosphatase family protein [Ruminococcus sp.]|uniref:histidine phosphatase family protein n=1 Tax=Ruminococcus sp. TaxID=41978 RepID=UPI0025FAAC80|nr:histidine phosphatase family protein [Ruminococcus sp.]MBQ6250526.1 histidine phosphatase family protein [Ruminococcus sp.]
MKIYSTRHGQTSYNKQEIILGTTDIELDETGEQQAKTLAERIAELGTIDIIIASPMKRAQKTARAVAERCGLDIVTEERFREWDYGAYEGKSRFTEGFAENKVNFAVRMGGSGESLLQLTHRVYSALDDIIAEYSGRTVLLVTHGGVCRVIETYFNDMTNEQFSNWFMDNCGLLEYNI